MTSDDLDRILASHDVVQPSTTFTKNVMAAIHREAAEPPHLPFPWFRFGIGVTASSVMAAAATILLANFPVTTLRVPRSSLLLAAVAPELSYAAAATIIGFAFAAVPRILSRS